MGRIAMVTRTINYTEVTALTVDLSNITEAGTPLTENKVFTLSGTYAELDKLMKALKKEYETDTLKVVAVMSTDVKEKLYGMTEQEFMALAKELPPRKTYGNTDDKEKSDTIYADTDSAVEEQPTNEPKKGKGGKRK